MKNKSFLHILTWSFLLLLTANLQAPKLTDDFKFTDNNKKTIATGKQIRDFYAKIGIVLNTTTNYPENLLEDLVQLYRRAPQKSPRVDSFSFPRPTKSSSAEMVWHAQQRLKVIFPGSQITGYKTKVDISAYQPPPPRMPHPSTQPGLFISDETKAYLKGMLSAPAPTKKKGSRSDSSATGSTVSSVTATDAPPSKRSQPGKQPLQTGVLAIIPGFSTPSKSKTLAHSGFTPSPPPGRPPQSAIDAQKRLAATPPPPGRPQRKPVAPPPFPKRSFRAKSLSPTSTTRQRPLGQLLLRDITDQEKTDEAVARAMHGIVFRSPTEKATIRATLKHLAQKVPTDYEIVVTRGSTPPVALHKAAPTGLSLGNRIMDAHSAIRGVADVKPKPATIGDVIVDAHSAVRSGKPPSPRKPTGSSTRPDSDIKPVRPGLGEMVVNAHRAVRPGKAPSPRRPES